MNQYLVEIDTENKYYQRFKSYFISNQSKQSPDTNNPADYAYAGLALANMEEDDKKYEGKIIYLVADEEELYPDAEIISLDEWAARFPKEATLTTLPEFYLVELDYDSPFLNSLRHFHVDKDKYNDFPITENDTHVGNTSQGWVTTDDPDYYSECDILSLEEWQRLRSKSVETY